MWVLFLTTPCLHKIEESAHHTLSTTNTGSHKLDRVMLLWGGLGGVSFHFLPLLPLPKREPCIGDQHRFLASPSRSSSNN